MGHAGTRVAQGLGGIQLTQKVGASSSMQCRPAECHMHNVLMKAQAIVGNTDYGSGTCQPQSTLGSTLSQSSVSPTVNANTNKTTCL